MSDDGDVTKILGELRGGEPEAAQRLWLVVYEELRRLADSYLGHEAADHTLQPTALVHEAYLRLIGAETIDWKGRAHFFAVAAQAMRRILIDHARKRGAAKRGGARRRVPLSDMADPSQEFDEYMVALDDALTELAVIDSQLSQVVELRFFGGLTVDEISELVDCAPITIKRRWKMARGWLHRRILQERDK